MRKLLILFFGLCSICCQSQDNLNSDPSKHNFNLKIDSNWRLVSRQEYEKQNPKGLNMLKNPELVCLRGYAHKDSINIMNPPAIIFQLIKLDSPGPSLDEIKSQADSILQSKPLDQQMKSEMTDEAARIWTNVFANGKTYFDTRLNGIISVLEMPGRYGILNIMYSMTYFGKGYMANLKLIYLDNNQKDILPSFLKMIDRSGFDENAKLK
jgi:hypothetical protein